MLTISDNRHYLLEDGKLFFWLGNTAWLIFGNITEDEAYTYCCIRRRIIPDCIRLSWQ